MLNRLLRWAAVVLCAAALADCKRRSKDQPRGYQDDSQIGTGQDLVDGTIGAPLRAARQARIDTFLYSVNQLIQTESLLEGRYPSDLDEVKALWKRETRREWPPPAFRFKYTYDPQTGTVGQVHKTPDEYTAEERGTGRDTP